MTTITGTEGADNLGDGQGDVTINALGGNDILFLGSSGVKTVSLGGGRDLVDVSFQRVTSVVFTDFNPGPGGDVLKNFATWYWRAGVWWTPLELLGPSGLTSPFAAGFARMQDSGGGALLQVRSSLAADWTVIATFQGLVASQLTQDNIGWAPDGSAAVGRQIAWTETPGFFQGVDTYGDDVIIGTDASGYIHYTQGADVIYAGGGSDFITGTGGITSGFKTIYGGDGNDQIAMNGLFYGTGSFGEPTGSTTRGLVYGGNGNDRIGGEYNNDEFYGEDGNDSVYGGFGNDTVDGGAGDDEVDGNAGDDIIRGGPGNDRIYGGDRGRDLMSGGPGDDLISGNNIFPVVEKAGDIATVTYFDSTAAVAVNLSDAARTLAGQSVATGTARDGFGGTDTLLFITNVIGSARGDAIVGNGGANALEGGNGADVLEGGAGDDTLDGGSGDDILDGGLGDDTFYLDSFGDQFIERAGEGNDRISTTLSFTLSASASIEMLFAADLSSTTSIDLTGNALAQTIVGNAGANILNGAGGGDTLIGAGGSDILIGALSSSSALQGGAGDDTYFVSIVGDSVIEFAGEGIDQVRTALVVFALPDQVEQLIFTGSGAFNGVGGNSANFIVGGAGANLLNGGGGDDVLLGGAAADILIGGTGANELQGGLGDDVYFVTSTGDSLVEAAGQGTDQVRTEAAVYTLPGQIEQLIYIGTGGFIGTGGANADLIVGGAGADILNGADGGDELVGGAGDDILIGGTGLNTLTGGAGRDVYFVTNSGDSVIESAGEGTDQVRTDAGSYALGGHVEELIYTGAAGFRGEGNALANLISGGAGADVLLGYGGDDALIGGLGADLLEGGDGADTLNGGGGADTLNGQAGVDQLLFDSALGGGNIDTVQNFATGTDRILLDRAVFTTLGSGALSIGAFVRGTAAQDADDRILYDQATGALFFDADGSGAVAAVQFATLQGSVELAAVDMLAIGGGQTGQGFVAVPLQLSVGQDFFAFA